MSVFLVGLKLSFNIEQDEYVPDLSESAGIRVLIHDRGEMPFPEDKGVDISPGRLTSVGIRKVKYHQNINGRMFH